MGSTPEPPTPLNPNQLANRQGQANKETAVQNASFNRLNQTDQFGNRLNYQRTGTDASGNPTYSVNQRLGALGRESVSGMRGLQSQFFDGANNYLDNPMQVNREVEDRIYNLGASRLDPRMDRQRSALESRLANQGIALGSEAYTNAQRDFGETENDAYNSLALNARGQAFNEALGERRQGVSELSGLAGLGARFGAQATNPQYAQVPQIGIPGIDMIGLEQNRYNQEYQNYQNDLSQRNAMLGGLGALGGQILTLPMGGGGSLGGNMIGGFFN